ncbi:MAG: sulfotransferase family 2 domain-containing protein [Gammaproteobacteria bacterium]
MDLSVIVGTRPPPIIDSRNKLILIWSAKAGCTFAVKWMFLHMGVFEEAFPRVHKYRVEKLYPSKEHRAAVEDFVGAPDAYRAVKFARSPFKRAVSSYIQAARFGYEDAGISKFLGRKVDATSRFSFREFLRYLETVDLTKCNIHHQLQAHALERRCMLASTFLVNLDHSLQTLPKLESFLGLAQSDPRRFRESHHHTRKPQDPVNGFNGDTLFDIFNKAAPEMPEYRSFYDADLEAIVIRLYAQDFLRYGFSASLNATS